MSNLRGGLARRALIGGVLALPLAACGRDGARQLSSSRGDRLVRWVYNTGRDSMLAPEALALMGISNEGRDVIAHQLGEAGTDGRYVISLIEIRKVWEFVLHRRQGDVLIFHNCDRALTRLASVRYPRNGKPTFIADAAFAEADFQQQLAFWIDRLPGR